MKESLNIRLRAIKESDIWVLHTWVNDPDIVKFTNFFHPVSEMEQKEWFASLPSQKNQTLFGIEVRDGEKLIGTCGFHNINPVCRKAELFIKICDKSFWGKGFGKETLELLLDFGFSDLNLRRIWLRVLANNDRAVKLYEKTGFELEGILKEDHYIRGEYLDIKIMGYLRKD